jgi:hypothetical protein
MQCEMDMDFSVVVNVYPYIHQRLKYSYGISIYQSVCPDIVGKKEPET